MTQLAKHQETTQLDVEKARTYLAHCRDFDEVKKLRDKSEAIAIYHRSQKAADESVVHATNISHHASRRLGELVREMPKNDGGRPKKTGNQREPVSDPTLSDLGITKKESAKWQAMAAIPEKEFEATLAEAVEAKKPVTATALIRMAPKKEKPPRSAKQKPAPAFDSEESARKLRGLCDDHLYAVPLEANLEPFISTLRGLVSQLEKLQKGRR